MNTSSPTSTPQPKSAPATTRVQLLPHADLCPQGLVFEARQGRKLVDELLAQGVAVEHACESYVALIDADRLDYYHRLERERIHLLLIDDAKRGLADIAAGRTFEADAALAQLQQRRRSHRAPGRSRRA